MGTWGTGSFDNDEAGDFGNEILKTQAMNIVADAVDSVPDDSNDYVEYGTAVRAIVSAELLAANLGRESGDVPDELQAWVEQFDEPDAAVLSRARRALNRVIVDSELQQLWQESAEYRIWQNRVKDLIHRLS